MSHDSSLPRGFTIGWEPIRPAPFNDEAGRQSGYIYRGKEIFCDHHTAEMIERRGFIHDPQRERNLDRAIHKLNRKVYDRQAFFACLRVVADLDECHWW